MYKLVAFVVLVSSATATTPEERWSKVKTKDDLWRFQVGNHPDFVSIGTEYVCLFTVHDRFVGVEPDHPSNQGLVRGSSQECTSTERFEVVFLQGQEGSVALKANGASRYISCQRTSPDSGVASPVTLQSSIGDNETFEIHINSAQDRIALFSPTHGMYLAADESHPDHVLTCGGEADRGRVELRGWKTGEKESWAAKEDFQLVATMANCDNIKDASISVSATVGVSTTQTPEHTVSDSFTVVASGGLRREFLERLKEGNVLTEVDWGRLSPDVFAKIVTDTKLGLLTVTSEVARDQKVSLYETVGAMGPFTIRGGQFKTKAAWC